MILRKGKRRYLVIFEMQDFAICCKLDSRDSLTINKQRRRVEKRFRKALAKRLGVPYLKIKNRLPESLNSTLIADCLEGFVDFRHGEIRGICQ